MKRTILYTFITALCLTACHEPKKDAFERLAKDFTTKCPQQVAENIRIDSMIYNKLSNTNSYYYTLSGSMDCADSITKKRPSMENAMIAAVRGSVDLKEYKDYKTTIEYIYFSEKSKKELLHIVVDTKRF